MHPPDPKSPQGLNLTGALCHSGSLTGAVSFHTLLLALLHVLYSAGNPNQPDSAVGDQQEGLKQPRQCASPVSYLSEGGNRAWGVPCE